MENLVLLFTSIIVLILGQYGLYSLSGIFLIVFFLFTREKINIILFFVYLASFFIFGDFNLSILIIGVFIAYLLSVLLFKKPKEESSSLDDFSKLFGGGE